MVEVGVGGGDPLADGVGDRADQLERAGIGERLVDAGRQRRQIPAGELGRDLVEAGEVLHRERQDRQRPVAVGPVGIDGQDRRPGHRQGEQDVAAAILRGAGAPTSVGASWAWIDPSVRPSRRASASGRRSKAAAKSSSSGISVNPTVTSPYASRARRRSTPAAGPRRAGHRPHRRRPATPRPGRRSRRLVVAAGAHGDRQRPEQQRRHDHRHDDPDPPGHAASRRAGGGRRGRLHQPRSSAPSLAVARVTFSRTSAMSPSVRLRSAACSRSR